MSSFTLYTLILNAIFFCFIIPEVFSETNCEDVEFCKREGSNILDDLLIVQYWNNRLNEKFPVTYNHLLQGGYFSMPSARMGKEGEMGAGYGYIHPYIHYNIRIQLVDFLEVTGSYRIFKGVDDPVLTKFGFGDFSDKGANLKIALFTPEDSHYRLPGMAIGMEDFLGTKSFNAYYVVFTQVYLKQNLEISLGFGANRIHGFFGGMNWMPFRKGKWEHLKNLSIALEYDTIPYKDETIEKHPKGRIKNTPWQLGLKYRLWDCIDFSGAYIRGNRFAFTTSFFYNFGDCKGLFPKISECQIYKAPINTQPIGYLRPEEVLAQDFVYALKDQGLVVQQAWIVSEQCRNILRIQLMNSCYREEKVLRERLNAVLSCLAPNNIDEIVIVIDTGLVSVQELRYQTKFLKLFREREIGEYELSILTPLKEVCPPSPYRSEVIYYKQKDLWNLEILPKTNTLFGSSRGKFKYALGLSTIFSGFLLNDVFYNINLGYFFASDIPRLTSVDRLNPSQLINVRTDIVNYFRCNTLTLDEGYLQKISNWGKGLYTRLSLGYFDIAYGGISGEWLYYPVNSNWAIGMDFAIVKKRTVHGLGFTSRVRKLKGFYPTYRKFIGNQYFMNLYYDWKWTSLEFKVSAGKFLANDFGFKTEVCRYFCSGLRIGFWYTYTNGRDKINNETYYDKGIFFTVPLDIFYTKTSRSRWGYGMSAWLRDVGASTYTGSTLYDLINQERQ